MELLDFDSELPKLCPGSVEKDFGSSMFDDLRNSFHLEQNTAEKFQNDFSTSKSLTLKKDLHAVVLRIQPKTLCQAFRFHLPNEGLRSISRIKQPILIQEKYHFYLEWSIPWIYPGGHSKIFSSFHLATRWHLLQHIRSCYEWGFQTCLATEIYF